MKKAIWIYSAFSSKSKTEHSDIVELFCIISSTGILHCIEKTCAVLPVIHMLSASRYGYAIPETGYMYVSESLTWTYFTDIFGSDYSLTNEFLGEDEDIGEELPLVVDF